MKSLFNNTLMLFMFPFIILGYLAAFVITPFMTGVKIGEDTLRDMAEHETTKSDT